MISAKVLRTTNIRYYDEGFTRNASLVLNLISTCLSSTTQNIKNNIYYQEYTVYHKWIAQAKFINRTIKKYHTVGTTTQSNVQILKRGEIDTPYTQIHNCGFSLFSTGTSIKSGGVEMHTSDNTPSKERKNI
jgi:hypothetical protein